MRGNVLYPLNTLKTLHPDLYEFHANKYAGREYLMDQKIPILECLWNDVLHFTAIHPSEVKKGLVAAGYRGAFDRDYYQIDPKIFDPRDTIVFICARGIPDYIDPEECVEYRPDEIAKYSILPQPTRDYYKEKLDKGESPLIYRLSPHILYKGTLSVEGLSVIRG